MAASPIACFNPYLAAIQFLGCIPESTWLFQYQVMVIQSWLGCCSWVAKKDPHDIGFTLRCFLFPWDFRYLNLPSPKIMRKIQRLEVFHHRQKSESPRLARSWCKTARSITFQTCPFVRWAPPARRPPPQCRKCPRMLVPRNRDDGGCREVVFTPRNGGEAGWNGGNSWVIRNTGYLWHGGCFFLRQMVKLLQMMAILMGGSMVLMEVLMGQTWEFIHQ